MTMKEKRVNLNGQTSPALRGSDMHKNKASEFSRSLGRFSVVALLVILALLVLSMDAFAGRQTFNANGTFTVSAGVTQITVEAIGGGGGGGGNAGKSSGTGGGGGGAYARSVSYNFV